MKRVALYLRVSSDQQGAGFVGRKQHDEEERYGIPRQEEACRTYAAKMGWTVVRVYPEAHTGFELWERPELTKLRSDFKTGEFDLLLVDELGRLSRNQYHQGLIFSEAERYGIEWDSATEDVDESPQGKAVRMIMGAFAEMEREKFIQRVRGGHMQRLKSGKLPPMPKPKYGYAWGDERKSFYVKNEDEARVIELMYDLSLQGHTVSSIRSILNEKGIAPPNGQFWWTGSVHRLLVDETYKGIVYANKNRIVKVKGKKRKVLRPQEEWILIPDAAPVIIPPEKWELVQAAMETRKQKAPRRNSNPSAALLRGGHIVCANCGTNLMVQNASERFKHTRYIHQVDPALRHGCTFVGIHAYLIDDEVWRQICRYLSDPDLIQDEIEKRQQDTLDPTVQHVTDHLNKLRKQHKKATERYLMIDDDLTAQSAAALIQILSKQITTGEQELSTLLEQQASRQRDREAFANISTMLEGYKERIDQATPEMRQTMISLLDVTIRLYPTEHNPRWEGSFILTPFSLERLPVTESHTDEGESSVPLPIASHTSCGAGYSWHFPLLAKAA